MIKIENSKTGETYSCFDGFHVDSINVEPNYLQTQTISDEHPKYTQSPIQRIDISISIGVGVSFNAENYALKIDNTISDISFNNERVNITYQNNLIAENAILCHHSINSKLNYSGDIILSIDIGFNAINNDIYQNYTISEKDFYHEYYANSNAYKIKHADGEKQLPHFDGIEEQQDVPGGRHYKFLDL